MARPLVSGASARDPLEFGRPPHIIWWRTKGFRLAVRLSHSFFHRPSPPKPIPPLALTHTHPTRTMIDPTHVLRIRDFCTPASTGLRMYYATTPINMRADALSIPSCTGASRQYGPFERRPPARSKSSRSTAPPSRTSSRGGGRATFARSSARSACPDRRSTSRRPRRASREIGRAHV